MRISLFGWVMISVALIWTIMGIAVLLLFRRIEQDRIEARRTLKCPEAENRHEDYVARCKLMDKWCIKDTGGVCEIFEEWVKEKDD